VLAVEANRFCRGAIAEILEPYGAHLRTEASALRALETVRQALEAGRPFDAVVLDYNLPAMDGLTLAQRVRSLQGFPSKILVLSSGGHSREEARRRRIHIDAHLMKPLKGRDLLRALSAALSGAPSAPAAPQTLSVAARRLRILVCEDNPVNQKLARRMLEAQGHEVQVACDGAEAVAATAAGGFDLVLMDVQMPNVDGLEATAAIRARERVSGDGSRIPIVAMTAHAMKGDRERCLAAGMDGYVGKPARAKEISEAIEAALAAPLQRP
jgi:two-component system sensor histidine kinase/response regulator